MYPYIPVLDPVPHVIQGQCQEVDRVHHHQTELGVGRGDLGPRDCTGIWRKHFFVGWLVGGGVSVKKHFFVKSINLTFRKGQ